MNFKILNFKRNITDKLLKNIFLYILVFITFSYSILHIVIYRHLVSEFINYVYTYEKLCSSEPNIPLVRGIDTVVLLLQCKRFACRAGRIDNVEIEIATIFSIYT